MAAEVLIVPKTDFMYHSIEGCFMHVSLSVYLSCWCVYVVPDVYSTTAWHCCAVYNVVLCVVAFVITEVLSLYYRMKNQHGHRVCWVSTSRMSGLM